ncbi:MAG: DUF1761 domain-containing protein [Calditrichaeota bacterium]|nr:MAG: DUF1761 domain-containing protein [Calditrichota bacterium]
MQKLKINHFAVWICIILQQVIPALWFSELLFGEKWMELSVLKEEDFANPSSIPFIASFLVSIFVCYLIAWLFKELKTENVLDGIKLSFFFWLAFVVGQIAVVDMFSLKPFALSLINSGYILVNLILTGILLSTWKRYAI